MPADKLILVLLLFSSPATAHLEVEPENFSRTMTAGSSYQFPFTVEWQGDEKTGLNLEYSIRAEETSTQGIRARISEDNINLEPGEKKDFSLMLNTTFGLKPDKFVISVSAENLTSSPGTDGLGGDGSGGSSGAFSASASGGVEQGETEKENIRDKDGEYYKEEGNRKEGNKSEGEVYPNSSVAEKSLENSSETESPGTGLFSSSVSPRPYIAFIVSGLLLIMAARKM